MKIRQSNRILLSGWTAASAIALAAAFAAMPAQAATCTGNCGTNEGFLDGDVTPSPSSGGRYDWVSTFLGQDGAAQIEGYSDFATNGSELLSDPFFGTTGQIVSFDFNYVTSDGAGYADYGFAQLINVKTGSVTNLFTARTDPVNPIVPGFNMPPVGATTSPEVVLVQPGTGAGGGPVWSPLGGSSGACWSAGCGLSGWVHSTFEIQDPGTYQLRFGAANWSDTAFDSGLAFSGLLLDGAIIGDGSSPDSPLLPGEIGGNGEFLFEFVATPGTPVWVDPLVATGYTYEVLSGPNIVSAIFPELGDPDGYEIYLLTDLFNPIATGVPGNALFKFDPGGVKGFQLKGIAPTLGLDPTNPTAFITGLVFDVVAGPTTINLSQTPLTIETGVPEPASWAMMIGGLAAVGGAMRRRRRVALSFA